MEVLYENITEVWFKTNEKEMTATEILSLDDSRGEVVVESATKIDGLSRGWVGNLTYVYNGVLLSDSSSKISDTTCVKDVLLARIETNSRRDFCMSWEYTFLKY